MKNETRGRPTLACNKRSDNYSISLTPAEHARMVSIGHGSITRAVKMLLLRSRLNKD